MNRKAIKNNIAVWIFLAVLAGAFFAGVGAYNFYTQSFGNGNNKEEFVKWGSPDETANYIFAKLYAQEGRLSIYEGYNLYAADITHPRSFRSDYGELKPVSFLGIILIYGSLAKIFSYKIIPFLTPFFAAVGLIYYYLLVKKIFGKTNALLSAVLLSVFPVYVYYSARSMFHNVLFIDLLIIGFYYGFLMARKYEYGKFKADFLKLKINWQGMLFAALSGFFIGLAIITRTSELIWLAPAFLILWLFNLKKIGFIKLAVFLSLALLASLPALYCNQMLYNSPYLGGYSEMNSSILNIKESSADIAKSAVGGGEKSLSGNFSNIAKNIFPFGLSPIKSLLMFKYYFVDMFGLIFWPAVLGFILFLQKIKKWKIKHYAFLSAFAVFSAILILYYGSWDFHDNPDPDSRTIGNSYTRYWLPIYLSSLPFVSLFLIRLSRAVFSGGYFKNKYEDLKLLSIKARKKYLTYGLRAAILGIIAFFYIGFTLYGSEEGLALTAAKGAAARGELEKITGLTEDNAAIITFYHDKLLFPERKVIVGLFDDKNMLAAYAKLADYLPLYYYNFNLRPEDIKYLNAKKLKEVSLRIDKVSRVTADFTLYKISRAR